MIILIGGSGRLGRAFAKYYGAKEVISLDRSMYSDWHLPVKKKEVYLYLKAYSEAKASILICAGILDPSKSVDLIEKVNYDLPRAVIEVAIELGIRVNTFGTILEEMGGLNNPYVNSKKRLAKYVEKVSTNDAQILHVRLHTLYGYGLPSDFMFIGQIIEALKYKKKFHMTSGLQLREYHHYEDDVRAIKVLNNKGTSGITDLSHGDPIQLRALAKDIFDSFGIQDQLTLGSIERPEDDNYTRLYKKNKILESFNFRSTLPALRAYVATLIRNK